MQEFFFIGFWCTFFANFFIFFLAAKKKAKNWARCIGHAAKVSPQDSTYLKVDMPILTCIFFTFN